MTSKTRWALITGVSNGGLGDALSTELLSKNINVIASSVELSLLDYLPSDSSNLKKIELNVTSSESINKAVDEVNSITGGRLDFIFNNAGYGYMMPLLDAPLSEVRKNFKVNVFGLLEVTQAFFPMLRAAKGMVINQSSIAGMQAGCQPVYWDVECYKSGRDCYE